MHGLIRRIERFVLGGVMTVAALVIERRLRALQKKFG